MGLFSSRNDKGDQRLDNSNPIHTSTVTTNPLPARTNPMNSSMNTGFTHVDRDLIKMFQTNFLSGLTKYSDSLTPETVNVDERIGVNFNSIPEEHHTAHSEQVRKEISAIYPNARVTLTRRDDRAWDISITGIFDLRDYIENIKKVETRIDISQFNYVNKLYVDDNKENLYIQFSSQIEKIKDQIAAYLQSSSNFDIENKTIQKPTRTFEELPGHKVRIKGLDVEITPQFVSVVTQYLSNGLKCRVAEVNSAYKNTTEIVLQFEHNNPEVLEKTRVADVIKFDSPKSYQNTERSGSSPINQPTVIPSTPPSTLNGNNVPQHLRARTVTVGDKK
jgi:hypothetical protein